MGRNALTRGGLAAALIALALYLLLGGDFDTGDGESPSPGTTTLSAPQAPEPEDGPAQGQEVSAEEAEEISRVLALVDSGGPFPHDEDGTTFENREGRLPDQPRGYYREYTVETPGSPDRGARRLVIGSAGETYYTRDHYDSFIEIDPEDY